MSLSSSHSLRRLSLKRAKPEKSLPTTHRKRPDFSERGRLLSAEGLDLGLPGIYRSVPEEESAPLISFTENLEKPKKKTTMNETQNNLILDYSLSPPQSFYSYKGGETDHLCDTAPLDFPVKPPRTKTRNRLSRKSTDATITSFVNPLEDLSPGPSLGPVIATSPQKSVDPTTECLISKSSSRKSNHFEESDDVFLEMEKTVSHPPSCDSGLKKLKKNKEKQENLSENDSVKKSKFFRTFSDVSKYKKREQLKASLSMPFDFQKISIGEMPKSRPLDLIESSRAPKTDFSDPPHRNHGWDDSHLPSSSVSPNPDILSHISPINKTRTLSYKREAIKYQTVARRPSASSSKKSFRLFRHFSYRKSTSTRDPQTDSLILVGRLLI